MMREFEIERQFKIKIEKLKPNKGVYILKTNKGNMCLKKINYGVQKLYFVYGAKEHLINNGFDNVDKYCLTEDGKPYALVNEDIYTLSNWIEGRECDFHNPSEIINATIELAKLHEASKGYEPPENCKLKTDLGRWPHLMEKRVRSFKKMRDMARKSGRYSDFDLIYLKNFDFYVDLGRRALNILDNSNYLKLCQEADTEKSFCHHDYTFHNIVIDKNDGYNVIDFDYCKKEIRAYDISSFMIKVLKRNDWKFEYAKVIINSYDTVKKITEDEMRVIFAFLLFPQRFWRLSNRYYYNEVNWAENTFNNKIQELINEKENYLKFIDEYKLNFKQME
ncbi:MAG: CotS family spore coat protein [Clostridiaceae bacterium]